MEDNVPTATDVHQDDLPAKKRRKHYRLDSILPTRPKKPPTGFTMFLKEYFQTVTAGEQVSQKSMLDAGAQWKALEPAKRKVYEANCADEKAAYDGQMSVWRAQKTFLKRPPSTYAMFLKEFWQENRASNTAGSVSDMGKRASELWKAKSAEEKEVYKVRYQTKMAERDERLRNLRQGNVIIGASGDLEIRQPQGPPPANQDDEDGDDDQDDFEEDDDDELDMD